ncbi:uncharacterized protein [Physcomitrium patens]|uniref:Uncharacterized protein n=1 Tax=Physcomitrium patens TaxID=3218 RepID=A0A7I4CMY9_PHYPA
MRCAQHNNFAHRLKLGENCDLVAMQTGRVACSLRVKCCQDLMVVECCCFRARYLFFRKTVIRAAMLGEI